MDALHEIYRTSWISDVKSVKQFRDNAFAFSCLKFNVKEEHGLSIPERMMLFYGDEAILEKMEKSCSATLLDCEDDDDTVEPEADFIRAFIPPKDNKLLTLKLQAKEQWYRYKSDFKDLYREMVQTASRYGHVKDSMELIKRKPESSLTEPKHVQVEHPEVILTVQIYRPRLEKTAALYDKWIFDHYLYVDQQFMVLGSQCLTELRDVILCSSDVAVLGEFSENPKSEHNIKSKDVYKSGFFYINGVFYNDMRYPQNEDYSKPIMEWSKNAHGVGPFSVAKMEDTKFIDLELRLGEPYLYQHQGTCEHMLVFSELRLMSSKDPQNMMDYPLTQILRLTTAKVKCMCCLIFSAKWMTTEDERLCELPFFFCDKCFDAFNYDTEGNKIAAFKAYKFIDRGSIFH